MSYRALFGWMNPWIFIPSLLISPVCQILLFAYIGRSAGVGDDEFYVIGNALNYAAIPCMSAMTFTIGGDRFGQTLGLVLATPARRIALFLGLVMGAINLVYRHGATMGNVFFLVLLIFTGTNVALDDLPGSMAAIGRCLPLSHAIEASRMLADGATWAAVQGLVGRELLIGMVYVAVGLAAIRWFEHLSRAGATLDRI